MMRRLSSYRAQRNQTRWPEAVPLMDSLLASIALAHDLTLATRNLADFKAAGVALLDPWSGN